VYVVPILFHNFPAPSLTIVDYIIITSLVAFLIFLYDRQQKLRKLLPYNLTKSSLRKPIKILSVVAGENLNMDAIEKTLYTTDINYNLLPFSSVSQESLLLELEKDVTVFELSSHGLNGSFRLGNASIPVTWLSTVLENVKSLECILLLYCNSYQDVEKIAANKHFAIGLVGDVKDTTCVLFVRRFYFYLNKKYAYRDAFDQAKLHVPVEDYAKFVFTDGRKDNVR
jgi:hypothetical protein